MQNMPRYERISELLRRHYGLLHPELDRLTLNALDRISIMLLTASDDRDLIVRMRRLATVLLNAGAELMR